MNIGKLLLAGGLAFGGYWLYTRRNLQDQIMIGTPRVHRLSGSNLILMLPVNNISDVDVTFNGFLGYFYAQNKQVGSALMQTPTGGVPIKAKTQTDLEVVVSLDLISSGSVIYSLISSRNWRDANAWLKGNAFIMSANVKIPVNVQML
jgi:hypothetical protein